MEPQRGRGMDVARRGPMHSRAKGVGEAGILQCTLPTHCEISDMITGDTGTYQITWHPGLDTEKRRDLGIAYQAHLVLKALPSIVTGFLLTEEEGHLQRRLQLSVAQVISVKAEGSWSACSRGSLDCALASGGEKRK